MPHAASQSQIAEIIELLVRSPIPASYQDAVMSSLHALDAESATALIIDLTMLSLREDAYVKSSQAWGDAWPVISARITRALRLEAARIEIEWIERLKAPRRARARATA